MKKIKCTAVIAAVICILSMAACSSENADEKAKSGAGAEQALETVEDSGTAVQETLEDNGESSACAGETLVDNEESSADADVAVEEKDESKNAGESETQAAESYEKDDKSSENLIPGGDFSSDNSHWGLYTESGGSASFSITGGRLKVKISNPGTKEHSVQIYCDGFELLSGGKYRMSFDISSDVSRKIDWRIQVNGGDYHAYAQQQGVEIGPDEKNVTYDFTMQEGSDPAPRLCFNIGDASGSQGLSAHEIYIDNVSLVLTDSSEASEVDMNTGEVNININQLGYRPSDPMFAYVRQGDKDSVFEVIDEDGKQMLKGTLVIGENKGSVGETTAKGDFGGLSNVGNYHIHTENNGDSFNFTVSENPYKDAFRAALKMFYLQRCGMELTSEYAGDFAHKACHTETATIYGDTKEIEISGGWHDAGDYGRYSVAGAKAVADLLLAYEKNPKVFTDDTGIPESGNKIPDVLDEARYELDWLIKMQNDEGGVYHKVTGLNFDGVVSPEKCTEKLYVLPASKTATADFAAVMFMASRVYEKTDKAFSKECKERAHKAIEYYEKHISDRNYTNPSDVLTGEYGDGNSSDEYLWALCEGYKTSGGKEFADKIREFDFSKLPAGIELGWANVNGYAFYAYLTSEKSIDGLNYDIKGEFIKHADELVKIAASENYNCTIKDDYPWGSNMTVADNGLLMLMADEISENSSYRLYAKQQFDYLCGANTNSYCFITGFGSLTPQNPHHRPSQTLKKCMPGMLVGGPDSNLDDPFAKSTLSNEPNAHRYFDNEQTYSCNEITIYWNSPLVYLMSYYVD